VQAVDGQAVRDCSMFAGAARVVGIFRFETGMLGDEAGLGRDQAGVFGGATFDVGLDEEGAAGDEHSTDLRQEVGRDDQAFGMALLPPRVGEMDEDGASAGVGKAWEGATGVFGEHTGAARKTAFTHAIVDDRRPFAAYFQAEQEDFRVGCQAFIDEAAAAGANFNLDRGGACTNQEPGIDLLAFGKARSVFVRIGFHGSGRC